MEVTEPGIVVSSGIWVVVVTEPEVGVQVWIAKLIGPLLGLVTELWVELMFELQTVRQLGPAHWVAVVIRPWFGLATELWVELEVELQVVM